MSNQPSDIQQKLNGQVDWSSVNPQPLQLSKNEIVVNLWIFNTTKDKINFKGKLYRNAILKKLEDLGYYKRVSSDGKSYIFIHDSGGIIREVSPAQIKDDFYSKEIETLENLIVRYDEMELEVTAEDLQETYLKQAHLIFNEAFLQHLATHNAPILKDATGKAYFSFKNGIVEVTREGIEVMDYELIDLLGYCLWADHIIQHEYYDRTEYKDGHFTRFIHNVCSGREDRIRALTSAIGYLLHNHHDPSKGQVVILYDETPAKRGQPEGGTGKGLLANAIKQAQNTTKIDGKKFDSSDRFRYQGITLQTQLFHIDDVRPEFDFEVLHSCSTDGWNVERKHKDEFFIPPEKSPKIVITSNTILENQGTTNRRRQFIIELSDYYSRRIKDGTEEPIRDEHGCMFFSSDWEQTEWNKFYSFMLDCCKYYLDEGLQTYEFANLRRNQLLQNTNEDFAEWALQQDFQPGKEYNNSELFTEFRLIYYGEDSDFSQRAFTSWMKKFAGIWGWEPKISHSNGVSNIKFYD